MALKRNKRGGRPSPYPRLPFHGLRTMQLLSSIVVSGIMCYFIYYLRAEHFPIPWMFINLLCISIATVAGLTITIILYNFTYLSPKFNLFLNGSISFFWALGLGLLSSSITRTHVLDRACTGPIWGGPAEAAICREYKTLWSMSVVGLASSLAAFALDIYTRRKTTKRGKYILPQDDQDAQRLNELKPTRARVQGYDAPSEQLEGSSSIFDADIGYHNRYGETEQEPQMVPHGPLGGHQVQTDMGYHNRFFRD